MSELTTVARPYAKAAFDFAKDGKSIDKWFDMLQFLSAVQQDKNFKAVQRSLGNSKLVDLLFNICSKQIDQYFKNFIRILVENDRLEAIGEIVSLFQNYMDEYNSEMRAEIVSPEPLSSQNMDKLRKYLEDKYSCKVDVVNSIDKSLISGVVIKTPNEILDASLKNKINSLYSCLLS